MQSMRRAFAVVSSSSSKCLRYVSASTDSPETKITIAFRFAATASVFCGLALTRKFIAPCVHLDSLRLSSANEGSHGFDSAGRVTNEAKKATQQGHILEQLADSKILPSTFANSCPAPYASVAIEGKGIGLIASRDIQYGERVIAEQPLFTFTRGLELEAVDALSPADQRWLNSLHNAHQDSCVYTGIMGILQTNSLSIDSGDALSAVFVIISRFNHSCSPNVQYHWNDELCAETVHACRDIACGEELCFSYFSAESEPGLCSARGLRQKTLQARYGFVCSCPACTLIGKDLEVSDARRQLIFDLDARIPEAARQGRNAEAEALVEMRLQLLSEEGLDEPAVKQRTTYYGYQVCKFGGWHERARTWLEASAQHGIAGSGVDTALHARYNRMLSRAIDAPHDPCYM